MAATRRAPAVRAALFAAFVLVSVPLLGRAALVESTSWIDAPLDGAVLPPAPYAVVAHSADQGGVAEMVFEVDGVQLRSREDGKGLRLLTSRFLWSPPGLGTFVLTVQARNADGEWGAPASATVLISDTAPTPGPTVEPGASPGESPTTSSSPGPTLEPGQTATPAPTGGATPAPTPTKAPTPEPTICIPPGPVLDLPEDLTKFDDSQANPLFEWHYASGAGCIASQTLYIFNYKVGVDLSIPLGAGARSYQQRTALPWDEENTFDQMCAYYHWYVMAQNEFGDGDQSAQGSFDVCELNPDG